MTLPAIDDRASGVLIVDDDFANRALMKLVLEREGLDVTTVCSGEDALASIADAPPDLIVLDIMMPGMSGLEVTRTIKGHPVTKHIPVIMVTALDDRPSRMQGLDAGAEDFLSKPVDRAELCVRVRNLLRLKAYADQQDRYSKLLEAEVTSRTADLVQRAVVLEQQAVALTEQAALLHLAQDAIVVRDMHDRILFWSRGAEIMYGWRSEEVLGRKKRQLLGTELSEPVDVIDGTLLRLGQWEGEATHHTRNGTHLAVASRLALQRDADGVPTRVLSISNDITARKLADAELLSLSERLSLATAIAKVGVWEWDLVSNALSWDTTMFEIYDFPPTPTLQYEQWSAVVFPEDLPAVEATLRRLIDGQGRESAEFRIVMKDGTVRNISAAQRVVHDERGNVGRIVGVNLDVTEQKTAEAELEQSRIDQLRFKDEFLSHVSHELRSPLTAIKQFTSILLGGLAGDLNEEQRQYQRIVLKNIHQLQSMIDDLLEVTRLETGKLTIEKDNVSVAGALRDVVDTFRAAANANHISLSYDIQDDLPAAYADDTRLRQILIILVDNAVKFTPSGGAVHIHAQRQPTDARFLLFTVSDTGCGVDPERIARLFDRLYQAGEPGPCSRKGLGLGLYICKELVTRQGGEIWVTSQPQTGSTFSFTLPASSLDVAIAPLLRDQQWPADSVALVTVETRLLGTWTSKEARETWTRESRRLLVPLLLRDLDVLLPTIMVGTKGECFFVVAFADEKAAAALAVRIREHFERLPAHVKQAGLTVGVSYVMVRTVTRDHDSPVESIVASMAANLEQTIKTYTLSEAVYYE